MDIVPVVVAAVVALAGGAVLGFLARGVMASKSIKQAEEKAALIVERARTQQKDLILEDYVSAILGDLLEEHCPAKAHADDWNIKALKDLIRNYI